MDPVKVRYRVVVSGRVQGVFYRASCSDRARELGVDGWVRNRPDGSVELEVQGRPDAVERLLEWCHDGPPRARVEAVEANPMDPEEVGPEGFRVVH